MARAFDDLKREIWEEPFECDHSTPHQLKEKDMPSLNSNTLCEAYLAVPRLKDIAPDFATICYKFQRENLTLARV